MGLTPIAVEGRIDTSGTHVIRGSLSVSGDPLAANNTLESVAEVMPRTRVLYVEGVPQSARYLTAALRDAGFDVSVKPPSAVPASAAAFDPWDVVVLSDVARSAIPDPSIGALTQWVEKGGGGLLRIDFDDP